MGGQRSLAPQPRPRAVQLRPIRMQRWRERGRGGESATCLPFFAEITKTEKNNQNRKNNLASYINDTNLNHK